MTEAAAGAPHARPAVCFLAAGSALLFSETGSAFLAPRLGERFSAEIRPRMIMQPHVADKTALVPAMRKLDYRSATVLNVPVEDHILNLTIAIEDLDAVELDAVAADDRLEPLEPAVVLANVDHVAIIAETGIAVAEPGKANAIFLGQERCLPKIAPPVPPLGIGSAAVARQSRDALPLGGEPRRQAIRPARAFASRKALCPLGHRGNAFLNSETLVCFKPRRNQLAHLSCGLG